MHALLPRIDKMLREGRDSSAQPARTHGEETRRALVAVAALTLYGACMGSHGIWAESGAADQWLQVLYSAAKVPLLLVATFAVCLPSFFILNALTGLASDFRQALQALIATQAGLAIILASLSPLTLLFYASSSGYLDGVLMNTGMFAVASLSAQVLIRRHYGPLIVRDGRHRRLLVVWMVLYAFVGTQIGWVLRPFIGNPDGPTHFLREDSWGNAYEMFARIVASALSR